jgi:ABC-type polysaccharide/polyol phosphate export permease
LTKERTAVLTVVLTVLYFIALTFLPKSVVGARADDTVLFTVKIALLAMSLAVATSIVLVFIFKRAFIKAQLAVLSRFRHLLVLMVKRDFYKRYSKSFLGVLWALLNPLLTMLVMTFVFSFLFRRNIPNFPVYVISGLLIYNFFRESTTLAMDSVRNGAGIIKKVYVPKYIFPFSVVILSLVGLLFSFVAFLLVFLFTRADLHWTLVLLPVPIIYTFVFSLGVAMFLSAIAVFFRDMVYLYNVLTMLLMYATPIFYPFGILPEWLKPLMGFNPLFQFISYFRSLAIEGIVPGLWENFVCIGFSLTALTFGAFVFMSREDKYILYL